MTRRLPPRQRGFSYLGVMFIVAMLGLTAAAATVVWQVAAQRDRERELVFAGLQYRQAIEQYQRRSADPAQRFPRRLEDLLRDPRVPQLVRDLRRLYPDPMTGRPDWGLLTTRDGGIIGVYSRSERTPLWRFAGPTGMNFATARQHRDWWFVAPSAAGLVKPPEDERPARAPSPDRPAEPAISNTDARHRRAGRTAATAAAARAAAQPAGLPHPRPRRLPAHRRRRPGRVCPAGHAVRPPGPARLRGLGDRPRRGVPVPGCRAAATAVLQKPVNTPEGLAHSGHGTARDRREFSATARYRGLRGHKGWLWTTDPGASGLVPMGHGRRLDASKRDTSHH